jgi:hypothetical protein
MTNDERRAILDSLTPEQRLGIAAIIRSQEPSGDWGYDDDGSAFVESVEETLAALARVFEDYDPKSVIE